MQDRSVSPFAIESEPLPGADDIEMPEGKEPRGIFEIMAAIYASYAGYRALSLATLNDQTHLLEWALAVFIGALAALFAIGLVIRAGWAMSMGVLMTILATGTAAIYFIRGNQGALVSLVLSGLMLLWMIEPVMRRAFEGSGADMEMPWWAAAEGSHLGRDFGLELKIVVSACVGGLGIIAIYALVLLNR